MRSDMSRIVHDSYRYGGGLVTKPGRGPRNIEDVAVREGIRTPHKDGWGRSMKEQRLHASPLRRFLEKQVGRPWNEVFSELSRTFDSRSPINRSVLERFDNWVTTKHLYEENGQVMEAAPYMREPSPVTGLYVHPRTGLLLRSTAKSWKQIYREQSAARQAKEAANERVVSKTKKLLKVDGLWFMVEFAPVMPPREMVICQYTNREGKTVQHTQVDPESICRDVLTGEEFTTRYISYHPKKTTYAKSKRQASRRELKQYGIL
jgi:hypothetical protein